MNAYTPSAIRKVQVHGLLGGPAEPLNKSTFGVCSEKTKICLLEKKTREYGFLPGGWPFYTFGFHL